MTYSTSINRFLILWDNDGLKNEVTWRAYDILPCVQDKHIRAALKTIGLGYAGEHATAQFCVLYEVERKDARAILGGWWLWSRLAQGRHLRVPKRTSGATTLAGPSTSATQPPEIDPGRGNQSEA